MPRKPDPVNPCASPWHLLGAELRYQRDEVRGLTLRQVGKLALCDDADLSKWERGLAHPQPDTVRRLDEVYGANGRLVALHAIVAELDKLRTLTSRGSSDEENVTERRRLLQIAMAGAGLGAIGVSGEPIRQLVDFSLGCEFRPVEDWERACCDHLHALRTRPPAQVSADLLIDLFVLRRQMDSASGARDTGDLHRVMAALSTLQANALTRVGDHGGALRWWHTARHAADASGDRELRLGVLATEAGHGLYGQRDPEAVLRLTESAQQIAGAWPSLGLALVICSQAKALTLLNRHVEALRALNACRDLIAADPPSATIMPGYWNGAQLPFAESQIHAGAGDEDGAHAAGEQVLALSGDYQVGATIRLHEALSIVVNGGIEEGMRRASSVIDALPEVHNDHMVVETGRRVLRAVPLEQRERPAVAEFRAVLLGDTSRAGHA